MTARELYEFALIEINKNEAPNLTVEDYVYFINKAVQQYINISYSKYDTSQQTSDDLRVLKTTAILKPRKLSEADDLSKIEDSTIKDALNSGLMNNIYYVDLPKDYVHLLNCIVEFVRTNELDENNKCNNIKGVTKAYTAKRLTSDMFGGILNNHYNKPSYKRPYYYINNINTVNEPVTNPTLDNSILNYRENSNDNGTVIKLNSLSGDRVSNASNVRLELRFGDSILYSPSKVYIDYLKSPMRITLTLEEVLSPIDTTQILEFPDYVCLEILNIFTRLIMENASDPRLSTNMTINQSIPNSSQSGN